VLVEVSEANGAGNCVLLDVGVRTLGRTEKPDPVYPPYVGGAASCSFAAPVSATHELMARRLFLALGLGDSAASSKANDLERLCGASAIQLGADEGHRRWPVSLESEP